MRSWSVVLVAVLTLVMSAARYSSSASAASSADAADNAHDSSVLVVKKLMERGQQLFLQKKYEQAADAFHAAYLVEPYAAFVYNEAVCRQKAGDFPRAISLFEHYLSANPSAEDAPRTNKRIASMKEQLEARALASKQDAGQHDGSAGNDAAHVDASTDGGAETDAGLAEDASAPVPEETMKSLVILESEPAGAPVLVFSRAADSSAAFHFGQPNPGWSKVATGKSPMHVTLSEGHYHIVMDSFRDFHRSETDLDVASGRIHQFKANLRQGSFLGFIRISTPVAGARIYLDEPPPHKRPPWGVSPHEGTIPVGHHQVWVERAGFKPQTREFTLTHGQTRDEVVEMPRIDQGVLRITGDTEVIEVFVDEKPVGTVGRRGALTLRLSKGLHLLRAEADDRKDLEVPITVPAGRVLPVDIVMVPSISRRPAWTQAIASAGFVTGGILLGRQANGVYDDLSKDRQAGILTGDDDRYTKGKIYAISSNVCFGLGGALAILSTYNFVKNPTPPSAAHLGPPEEMTDSDSQRAAPARPAKRAHRRHNKTARRGGLSVQIGANAQQQPAFILQGTF